ncbi:MAG: ATP synthase F0 subunit B [Deltaproteobacteria bacterium]|nr:ATP synthase F0 subunit B [Deltaproteobacteria bacterium]
MIASEIQLLPDQTVFFQLVIFLIVAVSLNHLVFKPTLRLIRLRRERTEGETVKIEELKTRVEAHLKEYQQKIREAKEEGFKIKEAIRKEGELQGHKILQEAKQVSQAEMEKIRQSMLAEMDRARKTLQEKAASLSKEIEDKVL